MQRSWSQTKSELPQRTPAEHIRWALDHPVDSAPLKELVKAGDKVCIIISDCSPAAWQSPETYIPVLIAELESAGVRDEDMLIISATGTHRRQTPKEHMGLVTKESMTVLSWWITCVPTKKISPIRGHYPPVATPGVAWTSGALACGQDHPHRRCGVPLYGGLRRRP